jgi:hypothetical protein
MHQGLDEKQYYIDCYNIFKFNLNASRFLAKYELFFSKQSIDWAAHYS